MGSEMCIRDSVRVDNPRALCPKFEGPYAIVSRPSRSQVTVKLGLFKDSRVRSQTYHWSSCKPAVMREGALEGQRPQLGRRKLPTKPSEDSHKTDTNDKDDFVFPENPPPIPVNPTGDAERGFSNTDNTSSRPVRSTRNKQPKYT